MKTFPKTVIAEVRKQMKPEEHLIEVVLTIRWVTEKDLQKASDELLTYTNKFQPEMRLDGYVKAKVLA